MPDEPHRGDWSEYRWSVLRELETLHRELVDLRKDNAGMWTDLRKESGEIRADLGKESAGIRELQTQMKILGATIVLVAGAFLGYVFKLFQP